jgi:uncharacterized protein (UPF0332 family)
MRKGKRALKVVTLALNAGDNDSAVSRSYYAMFDIARAALLRAGEKTSCHERIAESSKHFTATPSGPDKLIDNSRPN